MSQDDSDPCLFKDIAYYENDFDGDDEKTFISITGIDGNYDEVTTNSPSNTPNSGTMQAEGTYGFFTSPSDVHSNWIGSLPDTGNMLIINGEDDVANTAPYFVISESEVCPGADYFVTFNLVNVLDEDNGGAANNVDLQVRVNGSLIPGVTITAPYDNGNQQWLKVGLRLKANGDGEFEVRFENAETAANGNDFAIDNVVISNDPGIIDGTEDVTVVQ